MRRRCFLVFVTAVAALAMTTSSYATRAASSSPCSSGTVAKTSSYQLSLKIGPRQEMYTADEARTRKIKTGQVMLGGDMAMMESPPAGTKIYDLAVHVCTKTGAVVTTLKPTIVVHDPKAKSIMSNVPVAMMAGIAEGLRDYHYGNDVALTPGAQITVTVTIKGQRVVFRTTVPKRG